MSGSERDTPPTDDSEGDIDGEGGTDPGLGLPLLWVLGSADGEEGGPLATRTDSISYLVISTGGGGGIWGNDSR